MADRNFGNQLKHFMHAPTLLAGSFVIGAGAIGAVTGRGFGVAYTGAGNYLVTATGPRIDNYNSLWAVKLTLQHVAGAAGIADRVIKLGTVTLAAAAGSTFQILTHNIAGPALNEAATDIVHFEFLLGNSSLD